MQINPTIFKSYDIRGIYPSELNQESAYAIGNAFAKICQAKKIIIGRDMRLSSNKLFKALTKGINTAGVDVLDIGLVSTDITYYGSGLLNLPSIMITASHNPKNYNGFKLCYAGAKSLSASDGLDRILKTIQSQKQNINSKTGKIQSKNINQNYIKALYKLISAKKIKPLHIAVDTGNGIAGKIFPLVYKTLPCKITKLYFKLDGNFPNHQASPIESKNTRDLRKKIIEKKADFGMAFDGDGDRVFFFDEKGSSITASIIGALIAEYILQKNNKEKILCNAVCSDIIKDIVEKFKAKTIKDKVGHSYIKKTMRTKNIAFGAEHSGHYFYRDLFFVDSGMLTALIITQIISEKNLPLSEIIKPFQKYYNIEETNTVVKDKLAIIKKLKQKYQDGKQDKLDGLTIRYKNWWFNVRPSNTEPVLRLNLEADTKKLMQDKKKEILKIISPQINKSATNIQI